jgi:hypothetical protein
VCLGGYCTASGPNYIALMFDVSNAVCNMPSATLWNDSLPSEFPRCPPSPPYFFLIIHIDNCCQLLSSSFNISEDDNIIATNGQIHSQVHSKSTFLDLGNPKSVSFRIAHVVRLILNPVLSVGGSD